MKNTSPPKNTPASTSSRGPLIYCFLILILFQFKKEKVLNLFIYFL